MHRLEQRLGSVKTSIGIPVLGGDEAVRGFVQDARQNRGRNSVFACRLLADGIVKISQPFARHRPVGKTNARARMDMARLLRK